MTTFTQALGCNRYKYKSNEAPRQNDEAYVRLLACSPVLVSPIRRRSLISAILCNGQLLHFEGDTTPAAACFLSPGEAAQLLG
jgi:hypothetical protein